MENIFLFTWEKKYFLDKKLSEWIEWFKKKWYSDIVILKNPTKSQVEENILSSGLFWEKKFLIIYGLPKDTDSENKAENWLEEYFFSIKDYIGDDITLVLVSYSPDKRWKMYKWINENNIKTYSFDKTTLKELEPIFKQYWVWNEIWKKLYELVWSDPYRLENELKKYWSWISEKDFEDIFSNLQANSFSIFDSLIYSKNGYKSLSNLESVDQFQFFWGLMWALRNAILALDWKKNNQTIEQISKSAGIQSWQLQKPFKSDLDLEKTLSLFENLLSLDHKIKTWKLDSSLVWLKLKDLFFHFYND